MYGTIKFWNLVSETKYTKASVWGHFLGFQLFFIGYTLPVKKALESPRYCTVMYCTVEITTSTSTLYTYL